MGRSLRADIIIGGKADASFYALGDELQTLGSYINVVSEKLIQFGKESVDAYVSYEDAMLSAENALSTQYTSASELSQVMEQLNDAALEWANNSTFDTDDVAEAISEAAHSGWDLNQIMEGIPAAMNIAKAGGMDLATGLQYLVDISNAAGVEFEDLGTLVDYWAYAADSSSTTIPEMGEAMQKMGATMQFVNGDMAGLVTMLAVLADNGTKGSEAGTLLRNAMLRIIAPTQTAAEAMDLLDLSADELSEIYSDTESLEKANEVLEAQGFSAYDASGNLKNFTEIWTELAAAVGDMSEEDKYDVLSAIFPTRTITGALALLDAFGSEAGQTFYEAVLSNADGYTELAAENMESGLGGSLRHLESVYNALQTRTGSELADDVSTVSDALSGLIETINGMDDASFSALVTGLEGIAALGPSLIVAGSGFKVIGTFLALPTWAKVTVAAGAVAALAVAVGDYLDVMADERFEEQFGTNTFNDTMLGSYLSEMTEEYTTAANALDEFNKQVEASVEQYKTTAESFTSDLATAVITDKHLTDEEKQQFYNYGDEMYQALMSGLYGNLGTAETGLETLFGTPEEGTEDYDLWSSILTTMQNGYNENVAEIESLSQQMRNALTSAFADSEITEEERANIQNLMNQYNAAMAEIEAEYASAQAEAAAYVALQTSQGIGINGTMDAIDTIAAKKTETNATLTSAYEAALTAYLAGGGSVDDSEAVALYEKYQKKQVANNAILDSVIMNALESPDVDTASVGALRDVAEAVQNGGYFVNNDEDYLNYDDYDNGVRKKTAEWVNEAITALGGVDTLTELMQTYNDSGYTDLASQIQTLLVMNKLADNKDLTYTNDVVDRDYFQSQLLYDYGQGLLSAFGAASASEYEEMDFASVYAGLDDFVKTNLDNLVTTAAENFDLSQVPVADWVSDEFHDYAALYQLAYNDEINPEDYRKTLISDEAMESIETYPLNVDADTEEAEKTVDAFVAETDGTVTTMTLDVDSAQFEETINSLPELMQAAGSGTTILSPTLTLTGLTDEELEATGVQVNVDGDTKQLAAKIEAEDAQTLVEYLDGETSLLDAKILSEDGQTLTEIVDGNISQLQSAINSQNGKVITVWVQYQSSSEPSGGNGGTLNGYAEGGRATTASIFGEAGPEWAIPEEHSQRTAELLQSAAEASGFTWPELLSRTGGLNAGNNLSGYTLVYSPTIIAQDANGVEQKLTEDKKRLEKWMQDRMLRESLEVYA